MRAIPAGGAGAAKRMKWTLFGGEDEEAMEGRLAGKVKWFNLGAGYGAIECPICGEVFLHLLGLREGSPRALKQGDQVEFSVRNGSGRLHALDVVKV